MRLPHNYPLIRSFSAISHPAIQPRPHLPEANPWLAPIRIPLDESRIAQHLAYACWLPAAALPWLLEPPALLWAGCLLAGALLWQHRRRHSILPRPRSALLRADGGWELGLSDGRRIEARAGPAPLAHPLLTLIVLRSSIGSCSVAVWPDSLPAAQRRRLRASLLLGRTAPAPPGDGHKAGN